jgi:hypothetical protein
MTTERHGVGSGVCGAALLVCGPGLKVDLSEVDVTVVIHIG